MRAFACGEDGPDGPVFVLASDKVLNLGACIMGRGIMTGPAHYAASPCSAASAAAALIKSTAF